MRVTFAAALAALLASCSQRADPPRPANQDEDRATPVAAAAPQPDKTPPAARPTGADPLRGLWSPAPSALDAYMSPEPKGPPAPAASTTDPFELNKELIAGRREEPPTPVNLRAVPTRDGDVYRDVWEDYSDSKSGCDLRYLGRPVRIFAQVEKVERAVGDGGGWVVTLSRGKDTPGGYVCRCPEREADYLWDVGPGKTMSATGTVRAWKDGRVHLDDCFVHNVPSKKR